MKYHPDKNKGDKEAEKKFSEINNAYSVLQDPKKRQTYDQFGTGAFDGSGGFDPSSMNMGDVNMHELFEDIFSQFGGFGGGGKSKTKTKSKYLLYPLSFFFPPLFHYFLKLINFFEKNLNFKFLITI